MQRAPISAGLFLGVAYCLATFGVGTSGWAQNRLAAPSSRADHSALPYQVRIAPTTMKADSSSIEIGGDHWSARGYDLKTLIAQIYNVDARRIELGGVANTANAGNGDTTARFDVTVDMPVEVSDEVMQQVLEDAIQQRFHLTIAPESRMMAVYVLSAPNGAGSAMHLHTVAAARRGAKNAAENVSEDSADDAAGQITYYGKDCSGVSSGGIAVSAGTLADFRRTLEPDLDRVLLDETHLTGSYDFQVANYSNQQQLFQLLHDQLGLVVTPAERSVTALAVRPAASAQNQVLQAKL